MICQDAIEVWTCDEVIDFRTLNSNANIYRVGLYDLQWQLLDMVNHVTYLLSVSCISGKIKKIVSSYFDKKLLIKRNKCYYVLLEIN